MNSTRVWVIELSGVGIIEGTHARTRSRCIGNFVKWAGGESCAADGNPSLWKDLRWSGYRCVRAELTLEA